MQLDDLAEGIIINDCPVHFVVFSCGIINKLKKYIQTNESFESGGLLIGFRKGNHFEVTDITEPQKKDIRKKFFFERRDKKHITYLNLLKLISKNKKNFLGEWHTHPENTPKPSKIDVSEWQKTATENNTELLFLIIGQKDVYITTIKQ